MTTAKTVSRRLVERTESIKTPFHYAKCATCGERYPSRPRRQPDCLECEIRARRAAGESTAAIAARLDLLECLVECVRC